MKKANALTILVLVFLSCHEAGKTNHPIHLQDQEDRKTDSATNDVAGQPSLLHPETLLTKADAEEILGQPAQLADSVTTVIADTMEYKSAYKANASDVKTGKTGIIYFLFERYARVSIARDVYSSIKTGNENHEGFRIMHDMGDEAYFHSDGQNFLFVIVRKGEKMFRIKVNKITSTTSLDKFNQITKKISDAL